MCNLKPRWLNARIYGATESDQALIQSIEQFRGKGGKLGMPILLRDGMYPVEICAVALGISSD